MARKPGSISSSLLPDDYYAINFATTQNFAGSLSSFDRELSSALRAIKSASPTGSDPWLGAKNVSSVTTMQNGQQVNLNKAAQTIFVRASDLAALNNVITGINNPVTGSPIAMLSSPVKTQMMHESVRLSEAKAKSLLANKEALLSRGVQMYKDETDPLMYHFISEAVPATYKSGARKGQIRYDKQGNPIMTSTAHEFISSPAKIQRQADREERHKQEQKKARDEEREKEKQTKENRARTMKVLGATLLVLTAIYNKISQLVSASLERASMEVQTGRAARNLGVDPFLLNGYSYFATSQGLPSDTFTKALAGIQANYGDPTKGFKAPASFIATVRGDVAKLVQSGLANGENSDMIMRAVIDDYFKAFKGGRNALGQLEADEGARRRSLVTSLEEFSPEMASIFSAMLDRYGKGGNFNTFGEFYSQYDRNRSGMTRVNRDKLEEVGDTFNEFKSIFAQLKDSVFERIAVGVEGILRFLQGIDFSFGKDKYEMATAAYTNNVNARNEFLKRQKYYTSTLDEMLGGTYNPMTGEVNRNLVSARKGFKTEDDFKDWILKSRNGYLIASYYGLMQANQGLTDVDKLLADSMNTKKILYSDVDEAYKIQKAIGKATVKAYIGEDEFSRFIAQVPLDEFYRYTDEGQYGQYKGSDIYNAMQGKVKQPYAFAPTAQKLPSWYTKDLNQRMMNFRKARSDIWDKYSKAGNKFQFISELKSTDPDAYHELMLALGEGTMGADKASTPEAEYLLYQGNKVSGQIRGMIQAEQERTGQKIPVGSELEKSFMHSNLFGSNYQDFAVILQEMAKNNQQLFDKGLQVKDGKLEINIKDNSGTVVGTQYFPVQIGAYAKQN